MGLAASQARLLTITARKSDCEYQSMAYSHQKIALSRDMNIVSAEYQDALNQTKLVYDFYGTGDTSTQLSYGLLMQPSKLNDYSPSPITDTSGRVVLNAKLAAAARAAGIPQEGFGTTPSSDIRNKFVQGMIKNGIVTETVGHGIQEVQYNPYAGFGSDETIAFTTKAVTYNDFVNNYLNQIEFDFSDLLLNSGGSNLDLLNGTSLIATANDRADAAAALTLSQILNGDYSLYGLTNQFKDLEGGPIASISCIVDKVGSSSYWDVLFETLAAYLDPTDSKTNAALEYAKREVLNKIEDNSITSNGQTYFYNDRQNWAYAYSTKDNKDSKVKDEMKSKPRNYVGYVYGRNKKRVGIKESDAYGLSISNITRAYFTYFAQYMEGISTSKYNVAKEKNNCKFIDDNFVFNIVESVDTSGDSLLVANFYDTLFNQIATQGWVQNDQVDNNEYLQTMLQNGTMYISTLGDDSYYYQSNYSTNSYIKEITDEQAIAYAEAKYNREKQKINTKENVLDTKMKNLDTEISSLTTEYDSVKSVISKNVERSFKRYNA